MQVKNFASDYYITNHTHKSKESVKINLYTYGQYIPNWHNKN